LALVIVLWLPEFGKLYGNHGSGMGGGEEGPPLLRSGQETFAGF
jgi:hypothetical protein